MNDTTVSPSASDAGQYPVINVIEPDPPPAVDSVAGAAPDTGRFDEAAGDAVAARRRREFDAVRARLREQAIHADRGLSQHDARSSTTPAGERRDADTQHHPDTGREAALRRAPLGDPPERVRKRYLRSGNQYFLKEAPYQLAFEDIGPYLVTEHNRPDVVESMVDMVRAKAWERIRVSGHEAFRREAWLQATLLGIEVSGYEPKAADLARIAEGRRERMSNRIDAGESAPSPAHGAREADVVTEALPLKAVLAARGEDGAPRQAPQGSAPAHPQKSAPALVPRRAALPTEPDEPERQHYAGELVEHGGAPYQHNPARSGSYYVVYRDQAGADHVIWGVDLERAVAESGAMPGQQVTLENLGRRLVTVKVPVVDAAGQLIGEEEKDVYRNTWEVDIVGRERKLLEPAQSPPESESRAGRNQVGPEIADAARSSAALQAKPEDRAMQLAVIVAAMREQGFSERSIVRVQQRAEGMLDAFHTEGIAIPLPRVFDPKAPSARSRRMQPAAEQVPSREVERAPSEPSPPAL